MIDLLNTECNIIYDKNACGSQWKWSQFFYMKSSSARLVGNFKISPKNIYQTLILIYTVFYESLNF